MGHAHNAQAPASYWKEQQEAAERERKLAEELAAQDLVEKEKRKLVPDLERVLVNGELVEVKKAPSQAAGAANDSRDGGKGVL